MDYLFIAAGIVIVLLTLRDVIDSVVVPGSSQGWLSLAERIRTLTLPVWRKASARRGSEHRMSRTFAPFVLVSTLSGWTVLLVIGFGLVLYGVRDSFDPAIESFGDALYAAGASMITIGIGTAVVEGPARWGVLAAGFSGLFVITLTVTYILSVQTALDRRDTRLISLTALPGSPCSGIEILETYASIGCTDDLQDLFRRWADWNSAVAYSHSAHPALAYFRSVSVDLDWPIAIGAMLDAAAIHLALVDVDPQGGAQVLLASGRHAVEVISKRFDLAPEEEASDISPSDLGELVGRLTAAGYAPRTEVGVLGRFVTTRSEYMRCLAAVAKHLGSAPPNLV